MPRPPRLAGFNYIGRVAYFLTLCVRNRATVFREQARVDLVLLQIRRTAAEYDFAMAAYCVMPDHVHMLAEGTTAGSDLPAFVRGNGQADSTRERRAAASGNVRLAAHLKSRMRPAPYV